MNTDKKRLLRNDLGGFEFLDCDEAGGARSRSVNSAMTRTMPQTDDALVLVEKYIARFVEGGEKPTSEYVDGELFPESIGSKKHSKTRSVSGEKVIGCAAPTLPSSSRESGVGFELKDD